jgi:RHS repeat-associated protein
MDDRQRIAIVQSGPSHPDDRGPTAAIHLADHLGSSVAVLNDGGELINREEFAPYGETTFGSYTRKRYRFTGQERDEESGLSYHGARYYASWLGRWASPDPAGIAYGTNLYRYVSSEPIQHSDPSGMGPMDSMIPLQKDEAEEKAAAEEALKQRADAYVQAHPIDTIHPRLVIDNSTGMRAADPSEWYADPLLPSERVQANMAANENINLITLPFVGILEFSGRDSKPFLVETAPLTNSLLAIGDTYQARSLQPTLSPTRPSVLTASEPEPDLTSKPGKEVRLAATIASESDPELALYGPTIPMYKRGPGNRQFFNVVGHGAQGGIEMTVGGIDAHMSPAELADGLIASGRYTKGTPIRLLVCRGAEWAQQLVDFIEADVLASPGDVFLGKGRYRAPEGFQLFPYMK